MVPLFIKAPHQSSGIVETTPARTIDVLPTVAEHLGIELPWQHQGQPLTRKSENAPAAAGEGLWGRLEVELDDVAEGVLDATEYAYSIFGDGNGRIDPYSLGDYDGLIDRAPEEVVDWLVGARCARRRPMASGPCLRIGSAFVPGFIRGEVVGDVEPDTAHGDRAEWSYQRRSSL